MKRVGINFGAPGDRRTEDGTLWLDYPSVGGRSPDLPIEVEGKKHTVFSHSQFLDEVERASATMVWPPRGLAARDASPSPLRRRTPTFAVLRCGCTLPNQRRLRRELAGSTLPVQGDVVIKDLDLAKQVGPRTAYVKEVQGRKCSGYFAVWTRDLRRLARYTSVRLALPTQADNRK